MSLEPWVYLDEVKEHEITDMMTEEDYLAELEDEEDEEEDEEFLPAPSEPKEKKEK